MTIYNKEEEKEVLIICLEFVQPLFSGNGILCQSLVRGLLHTNRVTVLCARPSDHANEPILIESSSTPSERLDDHPNLTVKVVDVPPSTWRKLDRNSCYEHLAASAVEQMKNRPKHYHYVFAIDWSAIPTVDILKQNEIILSSPLTSSTNIPSSVLIFLVFRVFSSSKELYSSEDDYMFYVNRELDAVNKADITFVLSHVDQVKLSKIQEEQLKLTHNKEMNEIVKMKELHVHVPPLRNDFYHQCQKITDGCNLSSPSTQIQKKKKYVLCNVRLSPEKNALLFAKIMVKVEKTLLDLDLIPMMIGSVCDDAYAKQVYSTLPSQTIIVNKFLSSEELISILDQTVLMIHPPLYDAFGMTISEAAASGVPSLIHHKNIGASSLFRVEEGEILHGDMSSSSIHNCVKSYLESSEKLTEVSQKAKTRALSWNVNAYAQEMKSTIKRNYFA